MFVSYKLHARINFLKHSNWNYILPKYKKPTKSWPLHELKLTLDKNISKKTLTLLLPTKYIPNISSETVNIIKEDLTTDEKLEIMKNYFPRIERKNLLQDSYSLYDQSKFLSIYGSLIDFDGKKMIK